MHVLRAVAVRCIYLRLPRAGGSAGLDAVSFTLIIDDIIYPDGRTLMGVLGGGGAHILAAPRVSSSPRRWTPPRGSTSARAPSSAF